VDGATPRWRGLATWTAKVLVSVALLWFVLSQVDLTAVIERRITVDPAWLLLSIALFAGAVVLNAIRWKMIAQMLGLEVSLGNAVSMQFAGLFASQFLPGVVGGDAVRIWQAAGGMGVVAATESVLLERITSVLALLAINLALLPVLTFSFPAALLWPLAAMITVGTGGVIALLASGSAARFTPAWLRTLLDRYSGYLKRLAGRPTQLLLAIVIHLVTVTAVYALAQALRVALTPADALIFIPPVLLFMILPISLGGWGVREAVMVTALAFAGIEAGDALLLSIAIGLTSLLVSLPGVLLLFRSTRPPRSPA
jgi:glycosyltransferase 2 family protein